MGNHYHLLLETPAGNLIAGMQWLQCFNRPTQQGSTQGSALCSAGRAARLVEAGLKKLGLTQEEARHLRPNDLRKHRLMWLAKSRTVVQDAWLQGELDTGDRSNINRAAAAYCKGVRSSCELFGEQFCTYARADPSIDPNDAVLA